MKLILFLLTVLSCLSPASAQENTDSTNVNSAELRRSVDEFKKAYNRNDTAALAALYAEEAYYISPHVPDLIIRGRNTIKENWQRGITSGGHIDTVEILSGGSSCNLAYIISRYEATNNGVKVNGRNVLIMKRIDGKWLITAHASVVKD
jgi:ketosteroid isomerase-like protein